MSNFKHTETKAIRTSISNELYKEHSSPIYMTSSFTFDDAEHARAMFADEQEGNIYTRFSNPNNSEFIEKLAILEGVETGLPTASGMAAMFCSMAALLSSGDHIVASRSVFGSTHQLFTQIFPKWGIEYSYATITDIDDWESKIKPNTKMLFAETPSNPGLDLVDLEALGKLAEKHNIIFNVDNCFASPIVQQPAKFGADLVTHSATKYIDGQGRTIAGAILGNKELIEKIKFFVRHTGPSLSPFNSWLLSKSIETLPLRMEKHCDNALKIASYLEGHEELEKVNYPFLSSHRQYELAKKQMTHGGGIVTFVVKGGIERAASFLNNLTMLSLSANLGDTRTIATHPATTTHSKLSNEDREVVGIKPGLIRISVGLENVNDILEDIVNALNKSK